MEFGAAVANLALAPEKARSALNEVKKVGGMELAIEAVAVAGNFEIATKVTDASGIKVLPKHMLNAMKGAIFVVKHRFAFGMVAVSVIVAYVASIFAKA